MMKRSLIMMLVCAVTTVQSVAASPLSKAKASAVITAESKSIGQFSPACYPFVVETVTVKGNWAVIALSCHNNPDAFIQAVLRNDRGKWSFACEHGDDVMPASEAMKRCHLTHAQAVSLGFQDP